ncbi:MAG: methyltransferase domain-containing protein [Clostridiales bacterium]|nr:methyltransferase domain-containing protein [Clostridiales bacterium]
MNNVSKHYDLLIENGNDPVLDCKELADYMDKWDGKEFINLLNLDTSKEVLEIGCGTGRITKKIISQCKTYVGIDISKKTIDIARKHFGNFNNAFFHNEDFLDYKTNQKYDVIYSTLTFMHIKEKVKALNNVFNLLKRNGKFVLSIDKNQQGFIDTGYNKIIIYPDNPTSICNILANLSFVKITIKEIEKAYIITAQRS